MKYEEIVLEIRKLTDGEKVRLMSVIGPEVCEIMMQAPEHMTEMMSMWRKMMARQPDMMGRMMQMMAGMTGSAIKEPVKKG